MTKTTFAMTFLAMTLLMMPATAGTAFADHTTTVSSGESTVAYNGNCYAFIPGSTNFSDAYADAQTKTVNAISGHLATLTSSDEEDAADSTSSTPGWIGYTQDASFLDIPANVDGNGFGWITGEATGYTNWFAGEPNNQGGDEDYVENNRFDSNDTWNDLDSTDLKNGYYVEFDGACPQHVDIDIKPGSDPNSVNCKENKKGEITGVVPIGISTDGFDAASIDTDNLTLNGNPTTEVHGTVHIEDSNAVIHVSTSDICAATSVDNKGLEDVIVGGENDDGPFEGTDTVRIVKR